MDQRIETYDNDRLEDLERRLAAREQATRLIRSSIRDGVLELHGTYGAARVRLANRSGDERGAQVGPG